MSKKNFVSLIRGTVGGTVNTKVGEIASEVGMTPAGWNGGIFNMIRGLSETVIVPIAGIRLFRVADIVDGGLQRPLDIRGVKLDDIPVYRHLSQIRAVPPCGELRHLSVNEPLFLLRHIELHLNIPLLVRHRRTFSKKCRSYP